MWLLIDSSENKKELNSGDTISFGRSNSDIVLLNDASISRNHAKLKVIATNDTEKIIIEDAGSKYGTYFLKNNAEEPVKITSKGYQIKNNDQVRFGLRNHIFSFIFKPEIKYHVLISRVHENDKNNLQKIFDKIGGKMLNSWCDSCTHLTTTKTGITEKVACALASGIPIVNINYWDDVLKAQESKSTTPDPSKYLPPLDNSFLDDKQASLSPNLLRKKLFDGLVFYHFEKKQCDLYSTMIRLAGGRSLEFNKSFKVKDCVKDNIIIVLPPDEIETQSLAFENYQKISMELAVNKLRTIPSTEIALAIFYSSTQKFCNPKFKYKKLLKSTRVSGEEDKFKSPIIVEDSQGVDTSSKILKSQRIIPESVPLDSSVIGNSAGETQKKKLAKNHVDAEEKIHKKVEESAELFSQKVESKKLDKKKSDNQPGDKIQDKTQTHQFAEEKTIDACDEKPNNLSQIQKSAVSDSRIQNKNDKVNADIDFQVQEFTINKNLTVDDKTDKETNKPSENFRKNLIETSVKKKRKDFTDDITINDEEVIGFDSKKIKLANKPRDNNKSAWDILLSASQNKGQSRDNGKKIVKDKENTLNPENEIPDCDDNPVQNNLQMSSNNCDDKSTKQKETDVSWINEQKSRRRKNDVSTKSNLVEFIFIERKFTSKRADRNFCRRNQYHIPKSRLRREDMYIWESGK